MIRAFPNQLNQKKVIKLANSVVPDASITFDSNEHKGQFDNQAQFMHNQNIEYTDQQYWGNKSQAMTPSYYTPCTCSYCTGYRYY